VLRRAALAARRIVWPDAATRRFMRHNRRVWRTPRASETAPVVLIDGFNIPQAVVSYSYVANLLCRRERARLVVFQNRPLVRELAMYRVFRSFGARGYVHARTEDVGAVADEAARLLRAVATKRDLLELAVDGIALGQDVYESYLRRFSAATVDLADPRLVALLAETVGYLRFWQRYLDEHDVRAVIVSHDCYVENNILLKLAYQRGVAAYMPHIFRLVRLDRPHSPFLAFPYYRELFDALPPAVQEEGIALAASRLGRRLGGESGVDITFTKFTAFSLPDTGTRALRESDNLKVLICTHCFFDNPHVFGGMLFDDFYEWIDHLGRFAATTDHDWYLKTHPDPLPGTSEIIDELLARHPRLTLLPPTVSHPQLVREGIDVVLTCYGTVGEEYPLLGVPVVTAGYNPRIAYDFNHHATTLEEYDERLRGLAAIGKPEVDERDVFEFYFMHHLFSYADDLILDSFEAYAAGRSAAELEGTSIYEHLLDRFRPEKHAETIARIDGYLASGARFLYRFGPVDAPAVPARAAVGEDR
jgi:hypothetical protein